MMDTYYYCANCDNEAISVVVHEDGTETYLCETCTTAFSWGQADPEAQVYNIPDYLPEEQNTDPLDDGDLRRDEEAIERLAKEE